MRALLLASTSAAAIASPAVPTSAEITIRKPIERFCGFEIVPAPGEISGMWLNEWPALERALLRHYALPARFSL